MPLNKVGRDAEVYLNFLSGGKDVPRRNFRQINKAESEEQQSISIFIRHSHYRTPNSDILNVTQLEFCKIMATEMVVATIVMYCKFCAHAKTKTLEIMLRNF